VRGVRPPRPAIIERCWQKDCATLCRGDTGEHRRSDRIASSFSARRHAAAGEPSLEVNTRGFDAGFESGLGRRGASIPVCDRLVLVGGRRPEPGVSCAHVAWPGIRVPREALSPSEFAITPRGGPCVAPPTPQPARSACNPSSLARHAVPRVVKTPAIAWSWRAARSSSRWRAADGNRRRDGAPPRAATTGQPPLPGGRCSSRERVDAPHDGQPSSAEGALACGALARKRSDSWRRPGRERIWRASGRAASNVLSPTRARAFSALGCPLAGAPPHAMGGFESCSIRVQHPEPCLSRYRGRPGVTGAGPMR
jgi:hypothetical protein